MRSAGRRKTAHGHKAARARPPISEASAFAALEAAFPTPAEARVAGHSAPDASSAGQHIGRYEIRGVLGRGGMGSVYRAFDPVLEREVALKVMLPEMVGDAELKQRFEREARAVARLSHPCVVTVFDLGYHTDGSPYIVMELLRGRDLHTRIYDGRPFSVAEKVGIVAQVLGGLGHAHRAGIVHRDIKPANVFLTDDGTARIMDFGLAFFTASGATSRSILGTVAYMSSEQVRGGRLDGRSDLFSAGTVLCELLTGRRPFDADDPGRTLYRIANEEPDIVFASDEDRRRFLPILRRALARDPQERYPCAADFEAELRACLVEPARPVPAPAAPAPRKPADPSRLFELLRDVFVRGKTGQIHLACGGSFKSLTILKGQVLHGTSDAQGEHLGDVLVRYGLLSHDDMQRAVDVVLRERRRLGGVLGGMRLLDPAAIEEAVGIHVREILFSALDRGDASFSFEELAESNLDDELACPQPMGQVILEATRRVFDPELVRRLLGDTSRALTLSPDPRLRAQKMTLTPTDGFVLSRIDGTLSARELVALIPLPAEDTERSLFSLLCTGVVSYRENPPRRPAVPAPVPVPVPAPPPAASPERAANPYAAALPPAAPPEAVIRVATRALEAGATREAVQLLEPLLESAEGTALVAAAILLAQAYTRNPKWKKRAEAVLLGLVERVPRYARAHLMLGDMYRAGGLAMRAKAAYQRVLALDPKNKKALDALAELELPPPPTPAPPRFGGLFRRR